MRTGLAVTITEWSPVVDSASSDVNPPDFSDEEPLKKREERILNRISRAKSLRTAEVVYINYKTFLIYLSCSRATNTQHIARCCNQSLFLLSKVEIEVRYPVQKVKEPGAALFACTLFNDHLVHIFLQNKTIKDRE